MCTKQGPQGELGQSQNALCQDPSSLQFWALSKSHSKVPIFPAGFHFAGAGFLHLGEGWSWREVSWGQWKVKSSQSLKTEHLAGQA